jgi:hypothetical protein
MWQCSRSSHHDNLCLRLWGRRQVQPAGSCTWATLPAVTGCACGVFRALLVET